VSVIRTITTAPLHPGMRSGTVYYVAASVLPSASTAAVSANTAYAQPIFVVGTATRVGIEVTTGSAGTCRLGIYTNNNGVPGTLIVDAGAVDTTSIALVEATINLPVRDWVWLVSVFSATPTCRTGTNSFASLLGGSSPSSGGKALFGASTYGAMPTAAPTMTGMSSVSPAMWLRIA
jgi:hypothetical protein